MAGKPYTTYADSLDRNVYKEIDLRDSTWVLQTVAQMREAARLSGDRKWILEASLVEADYKFFRSVHLYRPSQQEVEVLAEEMIATLTSIVKQAERQGQQI